MKKSIVEYLAQVLLIVFSVVLGLYLSERIEDRKNQKEADKLLSTIKSELKDNKRILDYWAPYHREIAETLDSLIADKKFIDDFLNDKSTLYQAFSRGTIMNENPSNDAWDIAKSHPLIVNIDYDELLILSKIYNQQEFTFEPVYKMIDILLSSDLNSKEKALPNLELIKNTIGDIASREISLMKFYDEGEEILGYQSE